MLDKLAYDISLTAIKDLYMLGTAYDEITKKINEQGLKTATGKSWTVGNVRSVCTDKRRSDYIGALIPKFTPKARKQAAISEDSPTPEHIEVNYRIVVRDKGTHGSGRVTQVKNGVVSYICDFNKSSHDVKIERCVVVSKG